MGSGEMSYNVSNLGRDIFEGVMPLIDSKKASIFLVGAALSNKKTNVRKNLYDHLKKENGICVYFPESLLIEAFHSEKKNLLQLENLLAQNVHCVVMCIESDGSIAELGAFVNHKLLRKKLIVILNSKFQKSRSFITLGPVKMLNKNRVIWFPYENGDYYGLSKMVLTKVKNLKRNSQLPNEVTNPMIAERFILSVLFCLGSAKQSDIISLIKNMNFVDNSSNCTMTRSVLGLLVLQGVVLLEGEKYSLTASGVERLKQYFKNNYLAAFEKLDYFRVELLNQELRG